MGIFKTRKPPKHLATVTVLIDSSRARSASWRMHAADTQGVATDQARILGCLGAWADTFSYAARAQAFDFASTLPQLLSEANDTVDEAPGWDGIQLVPDTWIDDPQPYGHSLTGEVLIAPDNTPFTVWNWESRGDAHSPDAMLLGLYTVYEQAITQMQDVHGCSILLVAMKSLPVIIERDLQSFATPETTAVAVAKIFDMSVDMVADAYG